MMEQKNKKLPVLIALVAAVLIGIPALFICVERIPAGYVGVQYSVNGGVKSLTFQYASRGRIHLTFFKIPDILRSIR